MRILYGVVGDGMGHAIRSSVIIEKLLLDGHQVHIVASARAAAFLEQKFGSVTQIFGLALVMKDNQVKKTLTAASNLKGALKNLPQSVRSLFEVQQEFDPQVVISDFESFSWMYGKLTGVPVICVDNIQIINRCRHEPQIIAGDEDAYRLTRSVVKARTPKAAHYVITTFFYPEVRKKRTTLVPPILRQSILDATPTDGEHLLVYQTSETFRQLPSMLKKLDTPVYIYGLRRDLREDIVEDNLTFRPFSDQTFVEDLASCRGVIASSGFTLAGESVHLGKPYLATPVRKQFEQMLNARYIESLGYGTYEEELDDSSLQAFLLSLDRYRENLEEYVRHDNTRTFEVLDGLFDRREAGFL